jgi:hypothetical protein
VYRQTDPMDSEGAIGSVTESLVVDLPGRANEPKVKVAIRSVFSVFAVGYLWSLVLVSVPVLTVVGPMNYYRPEPGWYTGDDVMR